MAGRSVFYLGIEFNFSCLDSELTQTFWYCLHRAEMKATHFHYAFKSVGE